MTEDANTKANPFYLFLILKIYFAFTKIGKLTETVTEKSGKQ